ncbi:carbohydrate ABC transporter permease [Paenibacillus flagellatus]|uniref:Carbohydrate ABC transporter permease n=1 Tax=Paenibacillus flagellatus TaxID=2211139 RepID=A0A2V5K2K7_9BACL|nr:carbohydrate ABC transporter permease [Paenibacillus flagellatus]PYI53428.1 carbohydrate ABC transporter permease [Paenibacillus flagellatus]
MIISRSEKTFQWGNAVFFVALCFTMIAPMVHLLAVSLSSPLQANNKMVVLWPKGFQADVYASLLRQADMWRAMGVSVYITVMGTLLCLLMTSALAYTLTRPAMPGRKLILKLILMTFIFPVPLIPSYLVVKELGMINTLWALIIPGAVGAYNIFIMKTFFQGISSELVDAMKIDGSGEFGVYARLVLPLSAPVLATIALFHSVGTWNAYFGALIYIRSKELYPLQLKLKNMVATSATDSGLDAIAVDSGVLSSPETVKAAAILFTTVPILIVYPFLQKYFVKGAMLGSLKE